MLPAGAAARALCTRCLRPTGLCWCAALPSLETRTRVLILQHPRERHAAVGTARMAHLALPQSTLRVGVDFSRDPVACEAIRENAFVLFPGPDAEDVATFVPAGPVTLVVIDGTWPHARRVLRENPQLQALPQLCFSPARPSEYRIRRQPAEHCLATIEALAHVLGHLENNPARFEELLAPFHQMVGAQLHYRDVVAAGRGHEKRPARPPLVPRLLTDAGPRLVCVHGEVNGWSAGDGRFAEIVQWIAVRVATRERFAAVLSPRGDLAPGTAQDLGIAAHDFEAGESVSAFSARWRAFVNEDDVLVSWRSTAMEALAREVPLPPIRVDLRPIASRFSLGRTGTVFDAVTRLAAQPIAPWAPGRGGLRAAALEAVTRHILHPARALHSRARSA